MTGTVSSALGALSPPAETEDRQPQATEQGLKVVRKQQTHMPIKFLSSCDVTAITTGVDNSKAAGLLSPVVARRVMHRMGRKAPVKQFTEADVLRAAISRALLSSSQSTEPPGKNTSFTELPSAVKIMSQPTPLSKGSKVSGNFDSKRTSQQPSAAQTRPVSVKRHHSQTHRSTESIMRYRGMLGGHGLRNPNEASVSMLATLRRNKGRVESTTAAPIVHACNQGGLISTMVKVPLPPGQLVAGVRRPHRPAAVSGAARPVALRQHFTVHTATANPRFLVGSNARS